MAVVVPEAVEGADAAVVAAAAARRQRSSSGDWGRTARGAYQRVSTPSATMQTVGRLLWALALLLIALEVIAEATGQTWSFNLPTSGSARPPQPYQPLYPGQALQPAQDALVFTGTTAAPNLPLSNRSAGNQAAV